MEFKHTYCITHWEIYKGSIILYDGTTRYAYEMIKEYYTGEEWEGTAFLLTPAYGFDFGISNPITRESLAEICDPYNIKIRRIVFLNFDHLRYFDYKDTLNKYLEMLSPDEIWEWQAELFMEMPYTLRDRVRFMPMRYVSVYGRNKIVLSDPKFDFMFLGNLFSSRRTMLLGRITNSYNPIKIISGYDMEDLTGDASQCRAMLNIHSAPGYWREQLRISECICRNFPVVTEKDPLPYYPNLTGEYDYDSIIDNLQDLYSVLDKVPVGISESYRMLTQSDSAYEAYKNSILHYY